MELNKCVAEGAVDTVLEAIGEALAKDEDVRIAGFGKYATRSRLARADGIPRTGEEYRHRISTRQAGSEPSLADRDDAFAIGVHRNRRALRPLCSSMNRSTAASHSWSNLKIACFKRLRESVAKKPSTAFCHDAVVEVRWKVQPVCSGSHWCTFAVMFVEGSCRMTRNSWCLNNAAVCSRKKMISSCRFLG